MACNTQALSLAESLSFRTMEKEVDNYHLGDIKVTITQLPDSNELQVDCNDGVYHSAFTATRYEYKNYKRHMNQRIKNAFDKQHEEEE